MSSSLILASGSPRRKEILTELGIPYEVLVSGADEWIAPCSPAETVEELAKRKALSVQRQHSVKNRLILAADTVVALGDSVLGKPKNSRDAQNMLLSLSNRTHCVYTGVCLLCEDTVLVFHDCTEVTFAPLTDEQIAAYIATGEPMDKAGSYAIQGGAKLFVKEIKGSYTNVVGLPKEKLTDALKSYFPQYFPRQNTPAT